MELGTGVIQDRVVNTINLKRMGIEENNYLKYFLY